MAERERNYERRWARAAVTAVGMFALAACDPSLGGASDGVHAYPSFGQLNCDTDPQGGVQRDIDFSDHAAWAFSLQSRGQTMRLKIFGPESSVFATLPAKNITDRNMGVPTVKEPIVVDMLEGVVVTVSQQPDKSEVLDVTAACS